MKRLLTILLLLVHFIACGQDNLKDNIKVLLEITPNGCLPFLTDNVDYNKSISLDKEIVNNCFLKNDTNKLTYILKYYDNDAQENMSKKTFFKFRSITKFYIDSIYVVLYSRLGNDIMQIALVTYCKNEMIDQLMLGYLKGGGNTEVVKCIKGEIETDYKIKTKNFIWNSEYTSQKRKENPDFPRSVVTLSDYKIDPATGKINLLSSEKKYSKCSPEEFSYKNSKCELL